MFGCYWKLGQIENVFSVDCKIGQRGVKYFSLLFSLQTIFGDVQREKEGEKGLTNVQTQRERERRRTHDHAGQIAVLIPSMWRWVLCSSKHHRDRTPAPQHRRDQSTSKSSDPSSMSSDPHDPPMPDLSLSRSTSPFPSLVDHSLFLLLSIWPRFWC